MDHTPKYFGLFPLHNPIVWGWVFTLTHIVDVPKRLDLLVREDHTLSVIHITSEAAVMG